MADENNSDKATTEQHFSDAFDGKMLHPALDYLDDILTLGFSYRTKAMTNSSVLLISTVGGHTRREENESFEEKGQTYKIDMERAKHLPSLAERWGVSKARAFLQEQTGSALPAEASPQSGTLVEKIVGEVKRYIETETDADNYILAAWAIGTYFHRVFPAYSFVHIKAPKGSGKSQCLTLLKHLCFNANKSRPSVAALGDTVDALHGTYLIDQADQLGKKGNEDLLDILADSYKKSGGKRSIVKIEKGRREVLEFETYSPKAFASVKELHEDLRDRCLVLPLVRSTKVFTEPDDSIEKWSDIRDLLYRALLKEHSMVHSLYTIRKIEYRKSGTVFGRKLELWLPLEIMLEVFGGKEQIDEAKKRFFAQYGFAEDLPDEFEAEVFRVVLLLVGEDTEKTLSPKGIAEKIGSEYFRPNSKVQQNAVDVGRVITKFNIASEKKHSSSGVCYRFEKDKVLKMFALYFKADIEPPQPPPPVENKDSEATF